jgi:hypothetical protein
VGGDECIGLAEGLRGAQEVRVRVEESPEAMEMAAHMYGRQQARDD